jgi:hypothetical protein
MRIIRPRVSARGAFAGASKFMMRIAVTAAALETAGVMPNATIPTAINQLRNFFISLSPLLMQTELAPWAHTVPKNLSKVPSTTMKLKSHLPAPPDHRRLHHHGRAENSVASECRTCVRKTKSTFVVCPYSHLDEHPVLVSSTRPLAGSHPLARPEQLNLT